MGQHPSFRRQTRNPILARIKHPQDRQLRIRHAEADGETTLKADDAESFTNIIARRPTLGCQIKTANVVFDAVQIALGNRIGTRVRDPVIQAQKIIARLWRQDDLAPLHALALRRAAFRARTEAKASSTETPRFGSAFIAS